MKMLYRCLLLLLLTCNLLTTAVAQNSILVNFGTNDCNDLNSTSFSLINNPLSSTPSVLNTCSMTSQLESIFGIFIAYNPKDNKIYIADINNDTAKTWLLDVGLPSNIACPAVIPVNPTYIYSNNIPNNFEFDNNGNLWSFRNLDLTTGQCNMDAFQVTDGTVLSTKTLQFPLDNPPNTLSSGDVTILPNGRMFTTFGAAPSRLYEIKNYTANTPGDAYAVFLQEMPLNTYGVAYLNGMLELTGFQPFAVCYAFMYDIASNTLSQPFFFQNGQLPIDNTSITPAIGTTKQLVNSTIIDKKTADLVYEIYVRNLGNIIINDINVTDDLAAVYGAGNVSNVSASFVAGANVPGLVLNNNYNGATITSLLAPGQHLNNLISSNNDYYFKIQVRCRVTNLIPDKIYNNSAIATGSIGKNLSFTSLVDSSNNGTSAAVDPNNNGNANEIQENIPTPFMITQTTPVNFITVNASFNKPTVSTIKWVVATPVINATKFEVEYSSNGTSWTTLDKINITSATQSNYQYNHVNIPSGNIYYRIKEVDADGSYIYSRVILLKNNSTTEYAVYPNPASDRIQISMPYNSSTGKIQLEMFDALGRNISRSYTTNSTAEIDTRKFANGTYWLKITNSEAVNNYKVVVLHK